MPAAPLPGFTVSYARVEAALVRMHGIAPQDVSAFNSRLGSLQRGGLLGAANRPGKGIKLEYGPEHFHRVVLAIELTQAGMPPVVVLRLVNEQWNKLRGIFAEAEHAIVHPAKGNGNDVVLMLSMNLMFETDGVRIKDTRRDKLTKDIELVFNDYGLPARLLLVNLSAQLRKFHDALSHYHLQPGQLVEAALAPKLRARKRLKKPS
jgi:hypothetical protein